MKLLVDQIIQGPCVYVPTEIGKTSNFYNFWFVN